MSEAEKIVALLQSMVIADPVATHALITHRVPCNDAMRDHPHVVVGETGPAGRSSDLGLLGILNGLLLQNGSENVVSFAFDRNGQPCDGFGIIPWNEVKAC